MNPSEKNVRSLYQDWLDSWNGRSAEKMGELMAPQVNMIGFDGSQMNGKEDTVQQISEIFKSFPTGEFTAVVEEIRFIDAQTAVLRALAGIIPRGYKDINPSVNAIQTLIAREHSGKWLIEVFQNTPAAFHGRPELQHEVTAKLRAAMHSAGTTH
jgi:uncharacterized protein (TIGR02246 family)